MNKSKFFKGGALYNVVAILFTLSLLVLVFTITQNNPVVTSGSCSDFTGNQIACEGTSGCAYASNCEQYHGNTGSCTTSPGCTVLQQSGYCSDFSSNQAACTSVYGCSYPGNTGDCGLLDEAACQTAGCPVNTNSCSIYDADETSCNGVSGCSYPGNLGNCSDFNGNSSACSAIFGCSYPGNRGDCSFLDEASCTLNGGCSASYDYQCNVFDGDEGGCNSTNGCTWNSGDSTCSGNYFSSCQGSYDDGACEGNYDTGVCVGSFFVSCGPGTYDSGACVGIFDSCVGTGSCVGTYDSEPPTLSSAVIVGGNLTLTYNETLDGSSVPYTTDFSISINASVTESPVSVFISGNTVELSFNNGVVFGDTVTISYSPSGSNTIQDTTYNDAESLGSYPVTNNTAYIDSDPPTITAVSASNPNGYYTVGDLITITVTFSEAVTAPGNVTVTFETGDIDRTCDFSVSNSDTGSCYFTIQTGDTASDLDATITGAIEDQSANAMVNFTPATTLATNNDITIDTTVPTVTMTAPTEGAIVSGASVSLTASALDTSLVGVQFKRDTNILIGAEDTTVPFAVTWDTSALTNGSQTLIAVARDAAGNYATSTGITITVSNVVATNSGASGGGSSKKSTQSYIQSYNTINDIEVTTVSSSTASDTKTIIDTSITIDSLVTQLKSLFSENIPDPVVINEMVLRLKSLLNQETSPTVVSIQEPFLINLTLGDRNMDVYRLQRFLNSQGFTIALSGPGSVGNETIIFGFATRSALIRFQQANNIVPAAGFFGPVTRGVVNELFQ